MIWWGFVPAESSVFSNNIPFELDGFKARQLMFFNKGSVVYKEFKKSISYLHHLLVDSLLLSSYDQLFTWNHTFCFEFRFLILTIGNVNEWTRLPVIFCNLTAEIRG